MFGEYLIYYRGKIVGGIYDDRFLLKPVDSVLKLIPDAEYQIPYEGSKANDFSRKHRGQGIHVPSFK